jgi:hypothetical protein
MEEGALFGTVCRLNCDIDKIRYLFLREVVIKGLAVLLSLGVIVGCTQVPHSMKAESVVLDTERFHIAALEHNRVLDLLAEEDPSLVLYRDEATRSLVERFFTELTGSEKITRPILRYADEQEISLFLAFSVAFIESSFNPRAVNRNVSSVDRGLFQLNSRSFPVLKDADFFNPNTSAKYGIAHLRFCLDETGNDIVAIAMYNAGKQRVTARGAPLSTLEYISRYVDYRGKLMSSFREYIRDAYQDQGPTKTRVREKTLLDIKKRAK